MKVEALIKLLRTFPKGTQVRIGGPSGPVTKVISATEAGEQKPKAIALIVGV